jgi:mono/diheme cytochrome c family protein
MVRNGMSSKWLSLAVAAGAWCAANACATPAIADEARPAEAKITYTENVQAIFREHCYTCHNQDQAKSDLALDSYAATMRGGAGGEVVLPGDLESSRLWALVAHIETPKMPPEQDKLPQEKLDVIKKWILGGALESAGSKAKMAKKPKIDLNVTASAKKPEGPPPMPEGLFRQPFVTSKRPGAITAMATSPWAPLAAVSGQKQILLFNTDTAQMIGILPFPEGSPQVLQFSRNGSVLLCAGGRHGASGKVVLYDVKKGTRLTEIGDEVDTVLAADISPDQSLVVLGGPRKIIRVYDVADGSLEYESRKHTDWIYSAEFSPDGKYLATGDRAGGILIWEAETGREYQNLTGHTAGITGLSWRTDSKTLASSSEDGTVKVWDIDGRPFRSRWSTDFGWSRQKGAAVGSTR